MSAQTSGGLWHVPCCGWTGWIFGHSYQRFLVKEIPPTATECPYKDQPDFGLYLERVTQREYVVRCRRCGAE